MARYARKLTKQDLINGGITNITSDGKVFKYGEEIELALNTSGYKFFNIYDRDENGCCIKTTRANRPSGYYVYKMRPITLQRAMWAWFYDEAPAGFVIDHIDNNKDNYNINNFQLLTPGENVNKNKDWHTRELKCDMHKPREFYEKKLEKYLAEHDTAKYINNTEKAHKLRGNISQTRARIRYWDSHKEEYEKYATETEESTKMKNAKEQFKKEINLLKEYKRIAKDTNDLRQWHMLCSVIKNWKDYTEDVKEGILECAFKHMVSRNIF